MVEEVTKKGVEQKQQLGEQGSQFFKVFQEEVSAAARRPRPRRPRPRRRFCCCCCRCWAAALGPRVAPLGQLPCPTAPLRCLIGTALLHSISASVSVSCHLEPLPSCAPLPAYLPPALVQLTKGLKDMNSKVK
jgi:hypothetical protein